MTYVMYIIQLHHLHSVYSLAENAVSLITNSLLLLVRFGSDVLVLLLLKFLVRGGVCLCVLYRAYMMTAV
jgi:hypothetical protein